MVTHESMPHTDTDPTIASPGPATRKPSARRRVLTGVGALALTVGVLGFAGACASSADPAAPATSGQAAEVAPQDNAEAPQEEALPGIGVPVQDDEFEFTVTGVEPGGTHIGSEVVGKDAQGQFLLVHVTVKNMSNTAGYFSETAQTLVDTQGRQFSPDSVAGAYLGDANMLITSINPGNSVEGTLVFDVPADAVPATIELHDSVISAGVTVSLG